MRCVESPIGHQHFLCLAREKQLFKSRCSAEALRCRSHLSFLQNAAVDPVWSPGFSRWGVEPVQTQAMEPRPFRAEN